MSANPMTQGMLHTTSRTTSTPRDVYGKYFWLEPTNFPLLTVALSQATPLKASQTMFETQEDVVIPQRIVLDANDAYAGGSATTTYTPGLNVGTNPGDISYFQNGQRWRNFDKGQTLIVTQVTATTVTFAVGDGVLTTVTAAASGNRFDLQDQPTEQGGLIPTAIMSNPTFPYNYVQLFTQPLSIDDSLRATSLYNGKALTQQEYVMLKRHKLAQAYSLIYGNRSVGVGAENLPLYTSAGLLAQITTNTDTFTSGSLTLPLLNSFLNNKAFATGSMSKYCLINRAASTELQNIMLANSTVYLKPGTDQTYGFSVNEWQTSCGTVRFVLTDEIRETKSKFIFFEPENVKARVLQSTHMKADTQEPNRMGYSAAYITEIGWMCALQQTGAVYTGT